MQRRRLSSWLGHGLGAAIFSLSAAVQLNDPDPARWVLLYTAAALLAALAPLRYPALRRASGALALVAAAWGAWLLSADLPALDAAVISTDPTMKTPGVELWREGLGLLLVATYHALVALWPAR
ncbi:MAG: hypothetical protein ACI8S6_004722 [Myxococcota bacterium]|jgi:hypothetical protein